jgi:hypothetical protein
VLVIPAILVDSGPITSLAAGGGPCYL